MVRFLARRLLAVLPVLFIISLVAFSLVHLIPGDPATAILGAEAPREVKAAVRHELGLDRPLLVQYGAWLWRSAHGDLGLSLVDRTPVRTLIGQRVPVSFELAVLTLIVSAVIAVPLGTLAATRRGSAVDLGSTVFALSGLSMPSFFLGLLLLILFSVKLRWLPAQGYAPLASGLPANLLAMVMPSVCTGLREGAVTMRFLRSSLLEVLRADYVRTARAMGLGARVVIFRHALRNALIPVITSSGLQIAGLLSGIVITETIFTIPGFGRLVVDAIFTRDITVVQGGVLFAAVVVMLINLLVDVAYSLVDPRIRLSGERG